MPTKKQTAYLRLIRDIPGSTVNQLALAYDDRFGAGTGASETNKNAYQCLAKLRSSGWIRAGEPSLGRGYGHHLTPAGLALAGSEPLPPTTLPGYEGKTYPGSPTPTRYQDLPVGAVVPLLDGLGAPAMVGPVVSVHEQVRQAYAETQAPKTSLGERIRLDRGFSGHAPPHSPPKARDLSLYNIRSALQEARKVHEKILDSRGGPAVLVDQRFTAVIRALDLIVDKLWGPSSG